VVERESEREKRVRMTERTKRETDREMRARSRKRERKREDRKGERERTEDKTFHPPDLLCLVLLASVALTGLVAFKGTVAFVPAAVVLAGVGLLGVVKLFRCCCGCGWRALAFCGCCCSSPRRCKAADGATRRTEARKSDVVRMAPSSSEWRGAVERGGSL